jgi:D-alanyl-D-alanine carboxypeptidase
MSERRLLLPLLPAALLAIACAGDGSPAAPRDEPAGLVPTGEEVDVTGLQAGLDGWREDSGAFGVSLSLRVPGQDDVDVASGVDDREPEAPMPVDGTYQISSVTKTFVAAAVLQLVDEGRLALDGTVERWLPELADADRITVEMLLSHTAGLGDWSQPSSPTFGDYLATILADVNRSFTPAEALALHTQVPRVGAPGERFFYTDADYLALGLVVERVEGEDLASVLDERFLGPLELDETVLNDGSHPWSRHAWFAVDGDPDLPLDMVDLPQRAIATSLWASAAMLSSSEDLLDWADALYGDGGLLDPDTTEAMLSTPHAVDTAVSYGLGVERYCFGGADCPDDLDLVGHTGHDGGTTAWVAHDRVSGLSLVVHANVDAVDDEQLARLFDTVLASLRA